MMVARQPIFDRKLGVYGYELLYRGESPDRAGMMDSRASAQSIVNVLLEFGLNELVGDRRAFINITQELLLSGSIEALPKDRVVLEILESTEPTQEVQEMLKRLRESGFTIALDDFVPGALTEPLIPYANILKVDLFGCSELQAGSCVAKHRRAGLLMLAEKIETNEKREKCVSQGFELLQGHFLCRPQLRKGSAANSPDSSHLIHLIGRLQDPDITLREAEELVVADIALTYRLLRFVNSASFAPVQEVNSLRQAMLMLGLQTVLSVAVLISLGELSKKPTELVRTGLIRAKMAEELARMAGKSHPEQFYLVGLLSLLDVFLNKNMEEALEGIPLNVHAVEALVDPEADHPYAAVLRCIRAYERGDWANAEFCGLEPSMISAAYRAALHTSGHISQSLAA